MPTPTCVDDIAFVAVMIHSEDYEYEEVHFRPAARRLLPNVGAHMTFRQAARAVIAEVAPRSPRDAFVEAVSEQGNYFESNF